MNKSQLVEKLSSDADISKAQAERVLNAFIEAVKATLADGENLVLTGFGTFAVNRREARQGRNPQTGETMHIRAKNVPTFKAGSTLKDAVNQ